MKTSHQIFFKNSNHLDEIPSESIHLVVTSPPYPMIEMWDEMFYIQNSNIGQALNENKGALAFELMHCQLDRVWIEIARVLKTGGIVCINIGDATRRIGGNFTLFANHSRILTYFLKTRCFQCLPIIIWRKQTNAPNKFMGSGMMPPGAYITLEHEYVLILRKGPLRTFNTVEDKKNRRQSAFFWEERNQWFSDVWMDLKGTGQKLFANNARDRSAAFPFELPYRLISMFSVKGDNVLDPFLGMGTTMFAAMAAGRNSMGYEIEKKFGPEILNRLNGISDFFNQRIQKRLSDHINFIKNRFSQKGQFKHANKHYGFPVVTRQEKELLLNAPTSVLRNSEDFFEVTYSERAQENFSENWDPYFTEPAEISNKIPKLVPKKKPVQEQLFKNSS